MIRKQKSLRYTKKTYKFIDNIQDNILTYRTQRLPDLVKYLLSTKWYSVKQKGNARFSTLIDVTNPNVAFAWKKIFMKKNI